MLALSMLTAALLGPRPVIAQDSWTATVATTSPELSQRVARPAPLPRWANPQLINGASAIRLRGANAAPLLDASPITTGALPDASGLVARDRSDDNERVESSFDTVVAAADPSHAASPKPAPSEKAKSTAAKGASPAGPPASGGGGAPLSEKTGGAQKKSVPPALSGVPSKVPEGSDAGAALPPDATAAQQYCFNTAESAADARYAWQAKKIKEMESELEKRVAYLQAKTEEYKTWLAKRDEFARKAQEKLVGFYAKMKPDAAAQQFMAMEEDAAAALLMKLEPKAASLIMAEIEPTKAAKIASIVSGAGKIPGDRRKKRAGAQAGASAGEGKPAERGSAAPGDAGPRS